MSSQDSNNGEKSTAEAIADLSKCIKAIQADLNTLKREAVQSGSNSQPGTQDSVIVPGQEPPPSKRWRKDNSDVEEEDDGEETGSLVPLSEEASGFLEAAFKSKLDNASRKAKATKFGIPDSRWIRCPKMDAVVVANVSKEAERNDCAASRLQQFW